MDILNSYLSDGRSQTLKLNTMPEIRISRKRALIGMKIIRILASQGCQTAWSINLLNFSPRPSLDGLKQS